MSKLTVRSVDEYECLILSASTDDGRRLDQDQCRKLLSIPAVIVSQDCETGGDAWDALAQIRQAIVHDRRQQLSERNARHLGEETEKLERWSDDQKQTFEQELRELDRKIRESRKATKLAVTLADKLEAQKEQRALDALRGRKRRQLFEAQDAVDGKRDALINDLEKQLSQRTTLETIFAFRWTLG